MTLALENHIKALAVMNRGASLNGSSVRTLGMHRYIA